MIFGLYNHIAATWTADALKYDAPSICDHADSTCKNRQKCYSKYDVRFIIEWNGLNISVCMAPYQFLYDQIRGLGHLTSICILCLFFTIH